MEGGSLVLSNLNTIIFSFQNFIIRGSRQPQTLAVSLRLKDRPDFPPVQHFIVVVRGGRVALEDSDLLFDNIVSLAFHYTQVW